MSSPPPGARARSRRKIWRRAPAVPVDDDVSAAFAADSKADLPTNTKFLGDLDHGPKMPVSYTKTPRYRSVGFWGVPGDDVDISVASTDGGDAVAWLLDFNGKVIAWNDDASSDTYDAAIHTKLTASNGHYFIYFRDYDLERHHFSIVQSGGHPTDAAGDAERAWDAANGDNGPDAFLIDKSALPASARAIFDKDAAKYAASAWQIPGYYVVGGAAEEISWVDIYTTAGMFVVHGASRRRRLADVVLGRAAPAVGSVGHALIYSSGSAPVIASTSSVHAGLLASYRLVEQRGGWH